MKRLLYIEASPRKALSASIEGGRAFMETLRRQHPGMVVDTFDLWSESLPEFSGATISAKYARLAGREMDLPEAQAWQRIMAMVDRLRTADGVVIATPMWNFGVPYKLKHWIDLITQPGLTFSFNPESGYAPKLVPRPTLVILSSAGDYASGLSRGRPDLATPYLRAALSFIGLKDINVVPIGPTIGPGDDVRSARDRAHELLRSLAAGFFTEAAA